MGFESQKPHVKGKIVGSSPKWSLIIKEPREMHSLYFIPFYKYGPTTCFMFGFNIFEYIVKSTYMKLKEKKNGFYENYIMLHKLD